MKKVFVGLAVAGTLLVMGCQREALHLTDAGPTVIPPGWKVTSTDDKSITVAVPPSWVRGFTGMKYAALQAAQQMGNGSQMQSQQPEDDPKSMEAYHEPTTEEDEYTKGGNPIVCSYERHALPGEQETRFVVHVYDEGGNQSLDDVIAIMKESKPGVKLKEIVDTPMGKAAHIVVDFDTVGGDATHFHCYGWVDGPKVYMLKFTCTGDATAINQIEQGVLNSLRIKPNTGA